MNLDKIRAGVKSKLHESDVQPSDSDISAAILDTLETRADLSGGALYAHAAQRALELSAESGILKLPHTPTDRVHADVLIRALAPKVRELRMAGFGDSSAPFDTIGEAARWIEGESAKARAWKRERSEARRTASKEIQRLADEHGFEVEFKATHLTYQRGAGERVKHASTTPGAYLYRLARETRSMAAYTGFPSDALVMHVLTGLLPERNRAEITTRRNFYTLPSGETIRTREAVVTLRALDFTDKEMRKLYALMRGSTGRTGAKGLTKLDEHLFELVQDAGGPPTKHETKHGDHGKFWKRIREKLAAEYPDAPRTNNGVEGRYKRIMRRF